MPGGGKLLGDAPRTVEYWVHEFEEMGLAGLLEGERSGRPGRLGEKQLQESSRAAPHAARCGIGRNLWDGKTLAAWIDRSMGSTWGCGNASDFSGNWAFGCASRGRPSRKPIPNGKRRIKKLQALMHDAEVDLWATDEVHFQQHGSRCQMWVPPETKDPVLLHHPTRRVWDTSGRCDCGTGNLSSAEKRTDSTERPSWRSCVCFGA